MEQVLFVPGGMAPASEQYGALLDALGDQVSPLLTDFELYSQDSNLQDYSLRTELDAMEKAADEAGFDRFHLVGYSTCLPIAFVAVSPERVLSVSMIEPGMIGKGSFSPEDMVAAHRARMQLPPSEMFAAMTRSMLAPGVDPPPPPSAPPPTWMRERMQLGGKLMQAVLDWQLDEEALKRFSGPVAVHVGTLDHPSLIALATAIADAFPSGQLTQWDGTFHLNPIHRSEPAEFANALMAFWAQRR